MNQAQAVETTYVCSKCGAEDHDRAEPPVSPPDALHCYQCKAGQGMPVVEMLQRGVGMFPVVDAIPPLPGAIQIKSKSNRGH
jgi:ribosomal protein L40E